MTSRNEPVGTSLNKGTGGNFAGSHRPGRSRPEQRQRLDGEAAEGLDQPVLRFGGNAVDRRFFWTSTRRGRAGQTTRATRPTRSRPWSPGRTWPRRTPCWRRPTPRSASPWTWATTTRPGRRTWSSTRREIFGERLLSITVGNEPNGFAYNDVTSGAATASSSTSWNSRRMPNAIHAVAPNVPISGPGRLRPEVVEAVHRRRHPAEEDPVVPQLPALQLRRQSTSNAFAHHRQPDEPS